MFLNSGRPHLNFTVASAVEFSLLPDFELAGLYRTGEEQAATTLYERYARRLFALTRARCAACSQSVRPRRRRQAAFRVLFLKMRQATNWEHSDLWTLLVSLAINKARGLAEHHSAAKRATRRTVSTEAGEVSLAVPDSRSSSEFDLIAIREEVERLPERERRVVELRMEGYDVAEIANHTGRPRRTVERILQTFREQYTAAS